MSKRKPLYSTVCASPPTRSFASITVTGTPSSADWKAAVRPAGPAPMTTTGACGVAVDPGDTAVLRVPMESRNLLMSLSLASDYSAVHKRGAATRLVDRVRGVL